MSPSERERHQNLPSPPAGFKTVNFAHTPPNILECSTTSTVGFIAPLLSLQEKRSVLVILWILAFLAGNTLYVLYTFSSQQLYSR